MREDRRAAFDELYARTYPSVTAYALRRATPVEAADVVAETYLTVWRRWDDVPPSGATLPWLYGVARRVLANQRRSTGRQAALARRLAGELATRPSVEIRSDATSHRVHTALASLSSDDREILQLVAWEGLTGRQIATVFGCTTATARVRLHRARRRMAVQLTALGYDAAARYGLRAVGDGVADEEVG